MSIRLVVRGRWKRNINDIKWLSRTTSKPKSSTQTDACSNRLFDPWLPYSFYDPELPFPEMKVQVCPYFTHAAALFHWISSQSISGWQLPQCWARALTKIDLNITSVVQSQKLEINSTTSPCKWGSTFDSCATVLSEEWTCGVKRPKLEGRGCLCMICNVWTITMVESSSGQVVSPMEMLHLLKLEEMHHRKPSGEEGRRGSPPLAGSMMVCVNWENGPRTGREGEGRGRKC